MSSDPPLHQPNDKLFKQTFSNPETAAGFMKAYLPEPIADAVKWSDLKLEAGSFIDSGFRQHESDLLFRAPLAGSDVLLYCLFEHQTREDPAIALRLLRYMVRIWETQLAKSPTQSLPVILPVVLAQNEKGWKTSPVFSALFDLPESVSDDLRHFIPDFLFRLIQLAELPFDDIRGTPAGIVVMRVMKAERTNSLHAQPVWDEELLNQLPSAILEMIFRFMMNAEVDIEAIERNINALQSPQLKQTTMTLAQKIHQEGRQEGRQEGHQEGRQEGRLQALQDYILDVLNMRFENVPTGLCEEIQAITDDRKLHQLHRSAIQSPSIEAFAENL